MTTQINIVVDDGGLIQRNREQTDGNRWLTLEKNGQKLTARKSKEMRDQELAKQGKAPDGKPQSTAPAKPSFRRDEPAAQRQGGFDLARVWAYTAQGTTSDKLIVVCPDDTGTNNEAAAAQYGAPFVPNGPLVAVDLPHPSDPFGAPVPADVGTYNGLSPGSTKGWDFEYSTPRENENYTTLLSSYTKTQRLLIEDADSLSLVLPIDGNSLILVTQGTWTRAHVTVTESGQRVITPIVGVEWSAVDTHTVDVPEPTVETVEYAKAFYVGRGGVREVPMPMTLKNKLSDYIYKFSVQVEARGYYGWPMQTGTYTYSFGGFGSIPSIVGPALQIVSLIPTTPSRADFASRTVLSRFLMTGGTGVSGTAGVYKALQVPSADGRFTDPSNINNLKNTNWLINEFYTTETASVPTYSIQRNYRPAEAKPWYWGVVKPRIAQQGAVPYVNVKANRKTQYKVDYPVAWDWGKPSYCRQQLLALGFTAADLSPTPPTP